MSDLCAFDKVLYKILGGPVFARQNIIIQLLIDCCVEIIRVWQNCAQCKTCPNYYDRVYNKSTVGCACYGKFAL